VSGAEPQPILNLDFAFLTENLAASESMNCLELGPKSGTTFHI